MYRKYMEMYLKSSFQYRGSMLFIFISQILTTAAEFLAIILLFIQFKSIGSWLFPEVAIMFGFCMISFPLSECFGRGFDTFSKQVKEGGLDRMMIRPRSIFSQTIATEFEFTKLGKVSVGIIALVYGLSNVAIQWTFLKVLCIVLTIAGGFLICLSLLIFNAAFTIFTIEDIEVLNILTNGGRDICQYPLNIYKRWFTKFFTFVLPLASFNYLPVMYIIGRPEASIFANLLSPVWGALIFIPVLIFFTWSLSKYQGSGT